MHAVVTESIPDFGVGSVVSDVVVVMLLRSPLTVSAE